MKAEFIKRDDVLCQIEQALIQHYGDIPRAESEEWKLYEGLIAEINRIKPVLLEERALPLTFVAAEDAAELMEEEESLLSFIAGAVEEGRRLRGPLTPAEEERIPAIYELIPKIRECQKRFEAMCIKGEQIEFYERVKARIAARIAFLYDGSRKQGGEKRWRE